MDEVILQISGKMVQLRTIFYRLVIRVKVGEKNDDEDYNNDFFVLSNIYNNDLS